MELLAYGRYRKKSRCTGLGIGGMPNAVGSLIAESDLKDLGVHTEMYVDAFVDIAKAGKITGAKKNIDRYRQAYGFGAGTKKMYDYLDENPELMSAPVSYTNDIKNIAALDNFISINNCVDLDLYGQISSECSRHQSTSVVPADSLISFSVLICQTVERALSAALQLSPTSRA